MDIPLSPGLPPEAPSYVCLKDFLAEPGTAVYNDRRDGNDITLDQWDADLGDELSKFMEEGVRDHERVLVICTPEYKHNSIHVIINFVPVNLCNSDALSLH